MPTFARRPPVGSGWLHEQKHDGWRIQLLKDGDRIALLTRNGHNVAGWLPALVGEFRHIPVHSCLVDGELVGGDTDSATNVWHLQEAIRESREDLLTVVAFDVLQVSGVDYRDRPLMARKQRLDELVARAGLPGLMTTDSFQDAAPLLAVAEALDLEGIVSKRCDAAYRSGRCSDWLKVKSRAWLEANGDRPKAFGSWRFSGR